MTPGSSILPRQGNHKTSGGRLSQAKDKPTTGVAVVARAACLSVFAAAAAVAAGTPRQCLGLRGGIRTDNGLLELPSAAICPVIVSSSRWLSKKR
jgi:hypothetical protein